MSKESSREKTGGNGPPPTEDKRDSLEKLADFARRILAVPKAETERADTSRRATTVGPAKVDVDG